MKTEWDYTNLADAYLKRPDYSEEAIEKLFYLAKVTEGSDACDVGAGVAHLTIQLAKKGLNVTAVEPNDAMRGNGIKRTAEWSNVKWYEGTGEETGQSDCSFDLVTFGSSFNVTDRKLALLETARILRPDGWFACMWNHRNLNDAIQQKIEDVIRTNIEGYQYGSRREDQTEVIESSGLFGKVYHIEGYVLHEQSVEDCIEAWRSHATLERQAGDKFHKIIDEISSLLTNLGTNSIKIPYTTRIWVAKVNK